ncbi:hypothetical protein ACIBFB_03250 [Nocardiopsis sp. NPDC050513]|uniref:hypothetical protein n=1 Tax=Nocardiopsis sp. NPDC050513 TaxID=3364338 RepID=UPI0037B1FC57
MPEPRGSGAHAAQHLLDEVVVAHEMGHAVIAEAVGMPVSGIRLEFPPQWDGRAGGLEPARGHVRWSSNGVSAQGEVMALAGGVLAQVRWMRHRGFTDPEVSRAMLLAGAVDESTAYDTERITELERDPRVTRTAAFHATERLLDLPQVWGALRELVEGIVAGAPLRGQEPRRMVVPGDQVRQVMPREEIAEAVAALGLAMGRSVIALAPVERRERSASRAPGIAQGVRAAADGRKALQPGPSVQRGLHRALAHRAGTSSAAR